MAIYEALIPALLRFWRFKKSLDSAQDPTVNAKCAHALAVVLASWGMAFAVRSFTTPVGALLTVGIAQLLVLHAVGMTLAVLGLRELRRGPGMAARRRAEAMGRDALEASDEALVAAVRTGGKSQAWWAIVLSTIILGAVLVGLGRGIVKRWSHAPLHWAPFTSAEDEYRAEFPATPTLKSVTTNGAQRAITERLESAEIGGASYSVNAADFGAPAGAAGRVFDSFETVMASRLHGTIVDRHDISIGGIPGRELVVEASAPAAFVKMQMFMTERHYYSIMVSRSDRSVGAEDTERFLSSFALIPGGVKL